MKYPKSKLFLLDILASLQDQRPYELAEIEGMGRVLMATQRIEKGKLLCEYVGILDTFPLTHLAMQPGLEHIRVGAPFHHGLDQHAILTHLKSNEARFFASIPRRPDLQANCHAVALSVKQMPRVFIYTREDIEEGDILYIDSQDHEDTSHYIYVKNRKDLLDHNKCEPKVSSVSEISD